MFIRRSRVHPLANLPTPVARRRFIKEHLLLICVPRPDSATAEHIPRGSALVGRSREGGVIVRVVDAADTALQSYAARLRQAAAQFVAAPESDDLASLFHSEVDVVGRYDAALRRIERIDRPEILAAWLEPESPPLDTREAGPEQLMRLWDEVVAALGFNPTGGDPAAMRRALKQVGFLAEDYQASGLTRGADELTMLAMLLESRMTGGGQTKSE